jgi:hypothetical protein
MFSSNSFSTVSFSTRSFLFGTQPDESAPSGMRRLELYRLQEEALAEQKKAFSETIRAAVAIATPAPTKKKPKLEPLVPLVTYEKPVFKRKPIYTEPTPLPESLPAWLTLISVEINSWFTTLIPQWEARRQVIISVQKQEAANDADIRLRLLLLAA